ncbi:MAG: hypothetical protein PVH87_10605 [Desulfobacteraceae bacterium]|jgi:hypothetical protein
MKKTINIFLMLLVFNVSAWADDHVEAQTRTQLNEQAQQMVSMGVPYEAAVKMQNRFHKQQMVRARNIIQNAIQQGVPVDPVVDKALEGMAKNVSEQQIVRAMEQVRNRFAVAQLEARQITRNRSRQQTMTRTMAHTMAAGMPPEDVSAIAAQIRSRQRTMAREEYEALAQETCLTARDMARMGVSSQTVKDTVSMALQNGFSATQMNQMRSRFMHQSQNTSPGLVANQFKSHVRAGKDFSREGAGGGSGSSGTGSGVNSGGGAGSGSGGNGNGDGSGGNGGGHGSGGH